MAGDNVCERCGVDHGEGKCSAHTGAGKACRKWAVKHGGGTCLTHGEAAARINRGKPNTARLKHGLYGAVVAEDMRADHDAALASLKSDGGVSVVDGGVAVRYAAIARFFREHPQGPTTDEEREALFRALSSMDSGIKVRSDIINASKSDQPTSIIFAVPDIANANSFQVRGPDLQNATAIRGPNGETLLQCADGAWREHVKSLDQETGAEVYRPLLTE